MSRIYLIQHGKAVVEEEDSDQVPGLTKEGLAESKVLGEFMKKEIASIRRSFWNFSHPAEGGDLLLQCHEYDGESPDDERHRKSARR